MADSLTPIAYATLRHEIAGAQCASHATRVYGADRLTGHEFSWDSLGKKDSGREEMDEDATWLLRKIMDAATGAAYANDTCMDKDEFRRAANTDFLISIRTIGDLFLQGADDRGRSDDRHGRCEDKMSAVAAGNIDGIYETAMEHMKYGAYLIGTRVITSIADVAFSCADEDSEPLPMADLPPLRDIDTLRRKAE